MELSCDPEKAYSEGCCELSGVVSPFPFDIVLFLSSKVRTCVCAVIKLLLFFPWQCGGYAEIGLTAGRPSCKCMHGQPGVQGAPGPKVNNLHSENMAIKLERF